MNHLSFDECFVTELKFGRKKIFFTDLYRNTIHRYDTPEFVNYIKNLENLHTNIEIYKFTGDFNAHSQSRWAERDTNNEGARLDALFSGHSLTLLIDEPTHFRESCNSSCIDLILCDQPNLVIESGAIPRPPPTPHPPLDPKCKHQITLCKFNFKIPPLLSFKRHL